MDKRAKERLHAPRPSKEARGYEPGESVNEHSMVEEGNHEIAEKEIGQVNENQ